MPNQETETLRQIIKVRFQELEDHLVALEKMSGRATSGPMFSDYLINQMRYEMSSLSESLEELEERLVVLETYQTFIRFASRQITVVFVSVSLAVLIIAYIYGR